MTYTTHNEEAQNDNKVSDSCRVNDMECQEKATARFATSYCTLKEAYSRNTK